MKARALAASEPGVVAAASGDQVAVFDVSRVLGEGCSKRCVLLPSRPRPTRASRDDPPDEFASQAAHLPHLVS